MPVNLHVKAKQYKAEGEQTNVADGEFVNVAEERQIHSFV